MHRNSSSETGADKGLLRFAVSNEPVASVIFDGLNKNLQLNGDGNILLAIPRKWDVESSTTLPKIERYDKYIPLSYNHLQLMKRNYWFVISNGRFATQINNGLLYVVDDIFTNTDIVKSNIYINDPEMITINSMIDDLSYIFVGRNDGKIMRGSPLFWETRRSFSDEEEYKYENGDSVHFGVQCSGFSSCIRGSMLGVGCWTFSSCSVSFSDPTRRLSAGNGVDPRPRYAAMICC